MGAFLVRGRGKALGISTEAKLQADKARFRTRVNLSLAFSCFRALDGEAGDEERRGVSLLS